MEVYERPPSQLGTARFPTDETSMSVAGEHKKASEGGALELITIVFHAIIIAVVVRTLLFQPFNIPSGSLIPTLLIGDYIFVSKYSYGYSRYSMPFSPDLFSGRIWAAAPQRGDIAVFKLPKDNSTDYIKRVIGLPGDRIQMRDGLLYINGAAVKRELAGSESVVDGFGQRVDVPIYYETLPGGVRHRIMEVYGDRGNLDNTEEYVVPAGHYFMMGDNRDNSTDSRVLGEVGYVPFENFVGKAQIIFFSVKEGSSVLEFWKWPWTVRTDRLLNFVR
jgi:signal peptidase I